MSIDLFVAPAGGGKTEYCVQLARETAVSTAAPVLVCVPSSLQVAAWRRRLAAAGGAIGVEVITFDELVLRCLDGAGETAQEIHQPLQHRLLRLLIDQLPLQHYAPLRTRPGFIQVLSDLIAELKSARITPAAFNTAVTTHNPTPRLTELADIYTAYQERLQKSGWADRVGLQWLAAEALSGLKTPVFAGSLLLVDGFDDFSPAQLALLVRLAANVSRFALTLPAHPEVELPRYRRTLAQVTAAFGQDAQLLPVAAPQRPFTPLASSLFTTKPPPPLPQLHRAELPDRAAEARMALRWLKQRIVQDGIPAAETAVIARDLDPYRPFLAQIAAEFGLPLHFPHGFPLEQSPIIAALLDLLGIFLPDEGDGRPQLPRRRLIAAWRSPYFRWQFADLSVTPADADLLDDFARQLRVITGAAQWTEAFARVAAAESGVDQALVDEPVAANLIAAVQAHDLAEKFTRFVERCRPPAAEQTITGFVRWLEGLIGPDPQQNSGFPEAAPVEDDSLQMIHCARANPATAAADVAALQAFKEVLKGMVRAETAVGDLHPTDFRDFYQELLAGLSGARTAPTVAKGAITAAAVSLIGGLRFPAVALLGLSEGEFPRTISEDPFLRDADRAWLAAQFGFPLRPSTESSEPAFFYEAVTRAEEALCVTRPVLADNGADWVASPFWEALDGWSAAPVQPGEDDRDPATAASLPEWWARVAALGGAVPSLEFARIVHGAQVWRRRLTGVGGAWDGTLPALAPLLARRYDSAHIWSASRLEAYQTCAFFFFVQSVLGLQPRPEPEEGLDARQLGSLYHDILEKTARFGDAESETELLAWVTAVAEPLLAAAPAKLGFRETPWWAQTRQEIIANVTKTIWTLAGDDFQFHLAEAAFGIDGAPPLEIPIGEELLRLRGFIDRVDRRADGAIRIIDYKAGGKWSFSKKKFATGEKLQLPLYAVAAEHQLGLGEVVDGFYWHFLQGEKSDFQLGNLDGGAREGMETAVAYAWEVVQQVRAAAFAPQPPSGGCPAYCPAAAFCWHYTEGYRP